MLDIKNAIITDINQSRKQNANFVRLKNLLDVKMAAYLRYLATKNAVNRSSDYHYLCLAVTNSTAPVNGIDYIHPTVKPVVDYTTAVIAKGLMPGGEINFEFIADGEDDEAAARQATDMVSKVVNQMNDPHFILERWIMDANLHKNGMMMIKPIREQIVRYVETEGNNDQLRAFEQQASESGLTALRQTKRRISIDMERAVAEIQQNLGPERAQMGKDYVEGALTAFGEGEDLMNQEDLLTISVDAEKSVLNDAVSRNTIYKAKYKLTGYSINIKFHPIAQHYWICDPTVPEIKDQPFCGFYDPMTIQEALELYPEINLEEFRTHAEYNQSGAYQAGSVLNNLAIHARDSVPVMGLPVSSSSSQDQDSRIVSIVTAWNRFDIDGDGDPMPPLAIDPRWAHGTKVLELWVPL
jgi:hypothetical protein